MMVVDVSTIGDLRLSPPRILFEQRYAFGTAQTVANHDVSPDGARFVVVKDDSASHVLVVCATQQVNVMHPLTTMPSSPFDSQSVLRLAFGQPSAAQMLAQDIRHEEWLAMSEPFGSPKAS
jgi:hypothetical protein